MDEMTKALPLQYEDGPDYCTVRDAQGKDFALTMQPALMKAMEAALAAQPAAPVGEKSEWDLAHFLCSDLALESWEDDDLARPKYVADAKAILAFLAAPPPSTQKVRELALSIAEEEFEEQIRKIEAATNDKALSDNGRKDIQNRADGAAVAAQRIASRLRAALSTNPGEQK